MSELSEGDSEQKTKKKPLKPLTLDDIAGGGIERTYRDVDRDETFRVLQSVDVRKGVRRTSVTSKVKK